MFDPAQAKDNVEASKKRKKIYETNRRFQDTWATKLPWAESIVRDDGRVN
jgi:hypothetical protein